MQGDEMEGRELDALVAEKVMGWQRWEPEDDGDDAYPAHWVNADGTWTGWSAEPWPEDTYNIYGECRFGDAPGLMSPWGVWNPLEDIVAAWLVVGAFIADPAERWTVRLLYAPDCQMYEAAFWRYLDKKTGEAVDIRARSVYTYQHVTGRYWHKSAATAICCAALKAVGVEEVSP